MEILYQRLKSLTRFPAQELIPALDLFRLIRIPSRTVLLEAGQISDTVWFIDTGILRAFYHTEEEKRSMSFCKNEKVLREVTSWIAPEGGLLTDISSFLYQKPALYFIESLEPCRLYALSYENYQHINQQFPSIAKALFEHTLIMADQRVQMCNLRSPKERLSMFLRLYPGLTARLSVNAQASYLNIDPTTLSRLRGKSR